MTILVTGGAGYIGSHIAHALIEGGRNVVVLDDLSTGFEWLLPFDSAFYLGDCGDQNLLSNLFNENDIEAIIHCAGSIVVPDSVADPISYYLNNTAKSCALIASAVKHNVRTFVFSSTAAVYGDAAGPIAEDAALSPASPYGTSKMMTEIMLRDASRAYGLTYAALRYFNVAGADPLARTGQALRRSTHLIKVACQAAVGDRLDISIYGTNYPTPDGTCIRDYIHVSDLAQAHVAALDALESVGRNLVLNCGYGRGCSVMEVVDAVKRVSGVDIPVRYLGPRSGDPSAVVACVERIRGELDWQPRYRDLDTIVRHALVWEQKLRHGTTCGPSGENPHQGWHS